MASFSFRVHHALGFAGMVLSMMAIHCGGTGGNPHYVAYSQPVIVTAVGEAIPPDQPVTAGAVGPPYAVAPTLPGGVTLDAVTGILTGTPTATAPQTVYTVTAGGNAGALSTNLVLTVLDAGTPLYRVLNCQDVPQVLSDWCWAASAACVLNSFGNPVTQETIAGGALQDDGHTMLPNVMATYGHPGAWGPVLTFPEVQAQVSAGNPFIMLWDLGGGVTHDVVVYGWDIRKGDQEVYIMDPMDPWSMGGVTLQTYQWACQGESTDIPTNGWRHDWIMTFTLNP